ncbi:mucin-4 isoform X1 [Eurosta solidaginis]|uniref:mucin-4 isoform X1 n=1 Tax=Eurosta solidaginis TaxID=178769 RepID=UPI003531396A
MNISMLSTVACCAPRFLARVFFILLAFGASINAKVFERCEFAKVLHHKHSLSLQEVAVWTCIAQHSSNFNTEAHASDLTGGSHGLFQISDEFWCSTALKRGECNLQCERLYDADLTDDLSCARTIYNEHQRLSGNGYQAWKAYQQYCSYDVEHYTKDCFSNPWLSAKAQQHIAHASNAYTAVGDGSPTSAHAPSASASANAHATVSFYSPPTAKINSNSFGSRYSTHKTGKIYDRCELAQELYYKHKIPMEQVPTWVCIAQHESRFDTAAVGRLNADGSADHGIFQISDLYWCSHDYSNGGKACGMDCTKLLDNDISDDVRCIKRVHGEHTGITGDGFMAWSVYDKNCRNQQYNFIASCFKDQAYQHTAETNIKTTMENPTPHIYHANPYLQHISVAHKPTPTPTLQHTYTSYTSQKQTQKGKIYERCELAKELYFKHKFPMQDIATWVCIAQYESNFNTAAVGRLSGGGSADHGLFQISDLYWCTHDEQGGKACGISCAKLLDADLSDDVECVRRIHEEHTRLSGNGFTAWTVYNSRCHNQQYEEIANCFDSYNEISKQQNLSTSTQVGADNRHKSVEQAVAKGKIYEECELARELYYKHGMPLMDIPTWVCIAEHESHFDTSAVGRRNADGSVDHGIFQISDLYWCAHGQWAARKACGLTCDKLLDANISDDLKCAKIIYAEHTRLAGDGFTAWRVYNRSCSKEQLTRVSHCFAADIVKKAQPGTSATDALQTNGTSVGKMYEKCELAQELYFKHKIPMKDVPTWVCIAEHESSYNTAAVGRSHADGSADHGLFQISDLYCSANDNSVGGKACGISCNKLLDNDLADDMRCVKIIFDEHTRLTGNGFTAWTAYERNCQEQSLEQIRACFDVKEMQQAQQASGVRQSEQMHYVTTLNTFNTITDASNKKLTHKGELNHPFFHNPFLSQFSYVKLVPPTLFPTTTMTKKPIRQYSSKTDFLYNPFLSAFIQTPHSSNPKDHTVPGTYRPTKIPHVTYPETSARYQYNTFLKNFSTSKISTVTEASSQQKQNTPTTSAKTSTTRSHNSLSKVYVNSEMFRTTPMKTPVTFEPLKPVNEAQSASFGVKKTYVNSEMFRTTPARTQASLEQENIFAETPSTSLVQPETTAKLATYHTTERVGPLKTVSIENPFISKLMQSHSLNFATTTKTETHTNPESTKASGALFASNTLTNAEIANKVLTFLPNPVINQKHNYQSNPFLNKYTGLSSVSAFIASEEKKTAITLAPQTLYNPFLSNLSAATKVSTQKQTRITPSRTKQTTAKSGHSKLYINSEIFRTTPGRMQTTFLQPKPTPETQKLYNSFSKPYINTEIFRTMPVKPQASLEQPKPIPGTQKITKITTKVMPSTSTVSTKTTQKPSSQRTKEYFSTFLSTTTTKMPTAFSTAKQSPTYDKTQKVTRTQRPSITLSTTTATKIPETVRRIKTTTKAPYTTVSTTKLTNNQKTSTVPGSISRTTSAYTARKPLQQKQAISSSTAVGSTRNPGQPQMQRTTSTKTNKPTTYSSVSNTITTKSTRQPSTTNTPRSTTRMGTPTTQKASFKAKTTSRPTTVRTSTTENTRTEPNTTRPSTATYQNTNTKSVTKAIKNQYLYTTTTRTPISITRKPVSTTKSATRPTTATQSTTKKPQIQRYVSTSTRNPTAAIRPEITQKLYTTTKTPTTVKTTRRTFAGSSNLSTTTKVPYSTTKQNITNSFNRFNKKSQASTTTTRPYTRTTTASRATTRKHATTETIKSAFGSRRPTTLKPKATVSSNVTTPNPYRDHPFGHPFFAKSNDKFKALTSIPTTTTTRKSSTNPTTKYKSRVRVSEESKYYQQFKNHTTGNVKTVYAYSFGRNSTVAGFYGR